MLYSEASDALRQFAEATGIAVAETQAGKSAIAWDHPLALGAHRRHGHASPPIAWRARPTW